MKLDRKIIKTMQNNYYKDINKMDKKQLRNSVHQLRQHYLNLIVHLYKLKREIYTLEEKLHIKHQEQEEKWLTKRKYQWEVEK